MLIVEIMSLLLGLGPAPAYQVLVEDIISRYDLLLEALLVLEPLLLLFAEVALALIVGVLVVYAVVEVLVVELLVLAVELADAGVEADGHVLVNQQALHLLVYGLGLRTRLGVEGAQDNRARRVILHQGVIVGVNRVLGKLGVQVLRGPLALELLQLRFLGHVGEFLFDKVQFLLIEDVHIITECISILKPSVLQ